tara:strand:- start:16909 stop:17343 length:435 start_codon:yes stop_codon:yes gene_type:complete
MKIKQKHINDFKQALKKERLKFTNQRFIVFKVLLNNEGHFDCEDIIALINKENKKVSRATVYRTLDILVKYNFARKLILDDGIARYENKISEDHHDHMIDIENNEIIEFYSEELETLQDKIAEEHGYEIVKHIHQLFVKKKQNK